MSDEHREKHDRTDESEVERLLSLAGPRPEFSAEQSERMKEAVRPHWQGANRERSQSLKRMMLLTAAMLVTVIGFRLYKEQPVEQIDVAKIVVAQGSADFVEGDFLRQWSQVQTQANGVALRLNNGTSLRLDAATRVILEGPQRLRLETGAVYIDSQGQSNVEVTTPWGVVREIGTQFEVRLENDGLSVRVREGAAVLRHSDGEDQADAGEELVFNVEEGVARGTISAHADAWDWVQALAPPLKANEPTLKDLLEWASRETGLEVRLAEPGLSERQAESLRGDTTDYSPLEALDALLPAFGLRHRVDGGEIVLEAL